MGGRTRTKTLTFSFAGIASREIRGCGVSRSHAPSCSAFWCVCAATGLNQACNITEPPRAQHSVALYRLVRPFIASRKVRFRLAQVRSWRGDGGRHEP